MIAFATEIAAASETPAAHAACELRQYQSAGSNAHRAMARSERLLVFLAPLLGNTAISHQIGAPDGDFALDMDEPAARGEHDLGAGGIDVVAE
jgi:hypothetical protein